MCWRHHKYFSQNGLLQTYALPKGKRKSRNVVRKTDENIEEGICSLLINGVPCTAQAEVKKGNICEKHLEYLYKHRTLKIQDFKYTFPNRIEVYNALSGVCAALEDEIRCDREEFACGFCQRHYYQLQKNGSLKLLSDELTHLRDAKAPSPNTRIFLDKNVIFDYLLRKVLKVKSPMASTLLIQAILKQKVDATISIHCVSSAYGFLRLQLQKPMAEGGKELCEDEAAISAKEIVSTLFRPRESAWRFVSYEPAVLWKGASFAGTWEDGAEWEAFLIAKHRRNGPECFITRDAGFPEGIHPEEFLKRLHPSLRFA